MDEAGDNKEKEAGGREQPDFVAFEHEILDFWQKNESFKKLVAQRKGKALFRYLDGPITANNEMGVHHARGRTLKDIFIRFHSLLGYDCQFQNGFDCQGLWVEVEVEKAFGFKGKTDILAYGLDKFSQACKERVDTFSKIQMAQSVRLGQWMDWEDSYYTHTDKNIQSIWSFLKKCCENGWLYKSYRPMPWCARCGTSLSEHEMAGSYKDLKIELAALQSRLLVWTTTPWTLAANVALAVNPDLKYAQIRIPSDNLPLILSADVFEKWRETSLKEKKPELLRTFSGAELLGYEYEPIIPNLEAQQGFVHKTVPWKAVDAQEGTGVVHIAPGCGLEDFELSKEVDLPTLIPVDEQGVYVSGYGFLEGKNARLVADEIVTCLSQAGKVYKHYMHEHSYPVCWRCKEELIFRLVDEWYISTKEIRPKLIEASAQVVWQPEHMGKRMLDWLTNMGDWCISRKRYWGLPLPFYACAKCDKLTVVGSKEELQKLAGSDLSFLQELHRPWIDQVKIKCPGCGSETSRVSEVGDCWLDAGIVPFSTRGLYDKQSGEWAQADWICEMSEQVRLWFYSMLFMSVTLKGLAPYKRVLTYEKVTAEDGTKFSKSGYMIRLDEAAERMGIDTLRYHFASEPPVGDVRFGFGAGDETRRQLISIWNIFSFFMTYAVIDRPVLAQFDLKNAPWQPGDRWLMASIHSYLAEAKNAYQNYNSAAVVRAAEAFCDGVSNWYIRSNRRRFWKSGDSADKLVGYWTLFQAIRALAVSLSPIIPFLTEKIWQECVRRFDAHAAESVHLCTWFDVDASFQNDAVLEKVSYLRKVTALALRLRAEAQLKVRQPLSQILVACSKACKESCLEFESMLLSELNVKQLVFLASESEVASERIELDLKKAGPVLRGDVGRAVAIVNALDSAALSSILPLLKGGQEVRLPGYDTPLPASIFVIKQSMAPNLRGAKEGDLFVAINTSVTPELLEEGWVRDILRQIQTLRKDAGLEVQDRIYFTLVASDDKVSKAVAKNRNLIEVETLGQMVQSLPAPQRGNVSFELEAGTVSVTLAKL